MIKAVNAKKFAISLITVLCGFGISSGNSFNQYFNQSLTSASTTIPVSKQMIQAKRLMLIINVNMNKDNKHVEKSEIQSQSIPFTVNTTDVNECVPQSIFYKTIAQINRQFATQNEINQRLYSELVKLKGELRELQMQQQMQVTDLRSNSTDDTQRYKTGIIIGNRGADLRFGPGFTFGIYRWVAKGTPVYIVHGFSDWYEIKLHRHSQQTFFVYKPLVEVER